MKEDFGGFHRPDGRVGARNYLAVIPTVGCVNELVRAAAAGIKCARPLLHFQGCAQLEPDVLQVERVLVGLGRNPNVGAALVVSLGCESVSAARVAAAIESLPRPVELVELQGSGGFTRALARARRAARLLARGVARVPRRPAPAAALRLGIKCGASDATSGLLANPACGEASDLIVAAGGGSIMCETTEFMGAEDLLCERAETPEVAARIVEIVERVESEVRRIGVDMRGGQPSPGNMAGGITTIEEKSLGAVVKGGRAPIRGVVEYGEVPAGAGLFIMDSPGRELEVLAGLAAAGCNVMVFTTGRGAPQGFPLAPVVKVSANPRTCQWLAEHIDFRVPGLDGGPLDIPGAGHALFKLLCRVAGGARTRCEELGYDQGLNIYTRGPVL